LFSARDVAAIGPSVGMILGGDRAVGGTECTGLTCCDVALTPFAIYTSYLMMFASENLMLTRMLLRPSGCRKGCRPAGSNYAKRAQAHEELCGFVHKQFPSQTVIADPEKSSLLYWLNIF
jgi:hypothetical protein